jgi:predicted DNA-binding transcriptional regulator AlpA
MTYQSPQYQQAKTLLDSPETLTLDAPEAALLLGISKPHCYQVIAETGSLAGLPIIKIGNRIKIPVGPLRALLGVTQLAS